ncbi:MAG: DUF5930 domain-containing protein, partial [Caulobacterales bacterium]|uniref:DUF5930 domain-containing protein n=1 Tax=Glycocaulis sp. TaxID=1969725 RepID=UPI003FA085BE
MVKRLLAGPWELIRQRFPDRQIYHRSDGQVRYFAITTEMQVGALAVACGIAIWLTISTVNMLLEGRSDMMRSARFNETISAYQAQLEEARAAEAAAIAFLESRSDAFDRTAGEFQVRHDTVRRLLDFAEDLQIGEEHLSPSLDNGRILMAAGVADTEPRESLLRTASHETDGSGAEGRVASLMTDQDEALTRAEESAEARLENLRAVLRLTGLRLEEVVREGRSGDEGTGGPFVAIDNASLIGEGLDLSDPFNARVARIASRLVELEELERALSATPLNLPISGPYRDTSPYGSRIDPFTRRPAFHTGRDFAGARGTPIAAAAQGTVVYAGWRSGYGRTVEI